jgi:hypothetical protein
MDLKKTSQVLQTVEINRTNLYMLFNQYPELRPTLLTEGQGYLWTDAEIERLLAHLSTHKRGRPKKKS